MMRSFRSASIFLLSILISGLIASPLAARDMDNRRETARAEGDSTKPPHDIVQGPHVEGHIAFLHAELRITPAQESLWAPVAAAMREDVTNIEEADDRAESDGMPRTAVQYLQNRVTFANIRARGEARFLAAFQPLYNSLSNAQKKIADGLLMPHMPE